MTIDEAIAREREMAEMHRNDIVPKEDYHNMPWIDKHNEASMRSAEEHEQIAEWLEELSRRRVEELFRKTNEKSIRDKAIDNFQEWIKTQIVGLDNTTNEILVAVDDIWELATDKFKECVRMIDIEKHLTSYHDGGNDYRYAFSKEEVAEIKQALDFYESALKNEDGYLSAMCERKGYNKAIDDIKEKLMQNGFIYTQHALDVFNEISEQLKAGGKNE